MIPAIPEYSRVLVQTLYFDSAHIANGTIIVYEYNSTLFILHRIINVTQGYYIVKGDNCLWPDPPVAPSQVRGIFVTRLP